MKVSSDEAKAFIYLGLAAAGVYLVYRLYGAGGDIKKTVSDSLGNVWSGIKTIGTAVNPVDTDNLASRAAGAASSAVTGTDDSLGGAIYAATHDDPMAIMARNDAEATVKRDQSSAETNRLTRLNGLFGFDSGEYWAQQQSPATDPLGNMQQSYGYSQ